MPQAVRAAGGIRASPWLTPPPDEPRSRDGPSPVLSLIVPAYNEAATLPDVLRRLEQLEISHEIVVVDDCSTDGTAAAMQDFDGNAHIRLIQHVRNRGKGASLRTGFAVATGSIFVVQDADMEYDRRTSPR